MCSTMTPWRLCAFLVLAAASFSSGDQAPCAKPCVPLQSCAELAKLARSGYTPSAEEAQQLKSAKCDGESMVCCPGKNSTESKAKSADGGDTEVGTRLLGFGGYDDRPFGFNSWPFAPASYPQSQNPFGSPWGSNSPQPSNPGNSFGSPWSWDLTTTTRRPFSNFDMKPIRNPSYDYTTTRRPQYSQGNRPAATTTTTPRPYKRTTTSRPRPNPSSPGKMDLLFSTDVCGPTGDNRIFGGNVSSLFELPWMARLGYRGKLSRRISYRCGGALINNRYVLTAAHCVGGGSDPDQVRLGELDEQSEIDCQTISGERVCGPKAVDVDIERVIRHPGFSSDPSSDDYLKNDIALLRLRNPVTFTAAVTPLCLPQSEETGIGGKRAVVAGWGRDRDDKASGTRFLMKASVPLVESSDCARAYESRDISLDRRTQLCAGGEGGIDSCQGDSGGPLFRVGEINGEPRVVQHGIVSFGLQRCGVQGVPGVYTRVYNFMPWIRSNVRP